MNISQDYRQYITSGGSRIFRIPLEAFPRFWVNTYLVMTDDYLILVDTGSGSDMSNQGILDGFEWVSSEIGRIVIVNDLTHILLTHGHIDHMGGLVFLKNSTKAQVGVHELDLPAISNHEERMKFICSSLDQFMVKSGVSSKKRKDLLDMYRLTKSFFHSVPVDFTFEKNGMNCGPLAILHIPGHCPGHVAFSMDDFIFVGDHVINGITPHQSPERILLNLGVKHYLDSLSKLNDWAGDYQLILSGHDVPIQDLRSRTHAIQLAIQERLKQCLSFLRESNTLIELTNHMYPRISGYNTLLVIEKTGAYVEYLNQQELLEITNLSGLEAKDQVPWIYHTNIEKVESFLTKEEDYVLI